MLSPRQQQCLQGMGIRRWRPRDEIVDQAVAETMIAGTDTVPAIAAAVPEPELAAAPTVPAIGADDGGQRPPQLQDWEKQEVSRFLQADAESATGLAADQAESAAPAAGDSTSREPSAEPSPLPELRDWDTTIAAIHACHACDLAQNCTQKVPGIGDQNADLLIVGEGPGHDEDIRGEPFVGRSGQLLDRMLAAIGIEREQVYITNIVKCRPPNNRDPRPEEAARCRHYLEAQIRQIAPKVILSVGRVSAHNLLNTGEPVGKLIRQSHHLPGTDIPVKVTYHPAYLLRTPSAKAVAWQDLKQLRRLLS